VAHPQAAERETGLSIVESGSDVILAGLARDVTNARIDLVHFPVVYYFATSDRHASVAQWMPQLVRWARGGLAPDAPAHVRLAAGALDDGLNALAALLDERFIHVGTSDRDAVFRAFARDHALEAA